MRLIIVLGNPGKVYYNTIHNIGYMAMYNDLTQKNLINKKKLQFEYNQAKL